MKPLITRDNHDFSTSQLVLDAEWANLDDPGVHMAIICDDPRLAPGEADRISAKFPDCHRKKSHRNAFTGRKQHVELAPVGIR